MIRELSCRISRIVIQNGALDHIGEWLKAINAPDVVLVCTDNTVAELFGDRVVESLRAAGIKPAVHRIPPGDESKNADELNGIYRALADARIARDGMILNLGGGVVSDLAGFAAATWMRGIRYVNCPTTLEADVDASIGGKTAINHPAGKNLIGAFHHPTLVAADPECLKTLPQRDLCAGLAESIKHACIADESFLTWHETHQEGILGGDDALTFELVGQNMAIKASVVDADEHERGRRAILNFGHTIGHALERWFEYELRHGECVALGVVAAARISRALGTLSQADVERIESVLTAFNLPVATPREVDVNKVVDLTHSDKKVHQAKRRWVLLRGIGQTEIREDVPDELVRDAVASLLPG